MHESYIRYSAEEKETIVLSIKRSELSIEFHHKTKFANEMWQTDFYLFQSQGLGLVLSLYDN